MTTSRATIAALLATVLLPISACGDNSGETGEAQTQTQTQVGPSEATEHADDHGEDAAVPAHAGVVLSRDGLGLVSIGEDADAALARLADAVGRPNTLTKWLPKQRSLWGSCPGEQVRGAKWGDLWVLFGEDTALGDGRRLFAWTLGGATAYGGSGARTAEGIGVGSTVAELTSAYGERVRFEEYELGARFTVAPADGEDAGPRTLAGVVDGLEDDDQVRTLRGGLTCER